MAHFINKIEAIRQLPSAFWIVILATLLNQTGNMVIVFIMLYLSQSMHFTLTASALAYGIFSLSTLIASLFGGNSIDKIGALKVMILTIFFNGLILSLFPFVTNLFVIDLLCFLWGLTYGMYRPASQTFVSYLGKGQYRIIFSIYRLAQNLGMSIGPAVGGLLAAYSYPAIFYLNSIANFSAACILFFGLTKSPWFHHRDHSANSIYGGIKCLAQDKSLRWFVLGMLPISMVFFQHDATLAIFITQDLDLSVKFFGLLYTLNTVLIVLFELPINMLIANWRYRTHFVLAALMITLSFTALSQATHAMQIIFLAILWTIGEMLLYPAAGSYIAEIAPAELRGNYMSLYSACSNGGMLLGPLLGGAIMQHYGAINLWYLCGLWGLLSVYLFSTIQQPSKIVADKMLLTQL